MTPSVECSRCISAECAKLRHLVAFSDRVDPSPKIFALVRSSTWIWRTGSKKRSRSCDWTAYGLNRMKSELEAFSRKRHCRVPRPSLRRSTRFGESFESAIWRFASEPWVWGSDLRTLMAFGSGKVMRL